MVFKYDISFLQEAHILISKIEQMVSDILFYEREEQTGDFTWNHEQKLLTAIRDGDIEQAELCLQENILHEKDDRRKYKLSEDPIRQMKYRLVMAITLFTRAAIAGGVPDLVAFAMNDSYILTLDQCADIPELHVLYVDAVRSYAEKALEYRVRRIEDDGKAKADEMQNYIIRHLHSKISVSQVANSAGISPSYAMHLFKSITGISIYEYMQSERLKAAENLLRFSNYSISEISNYLAFSTQSGFSKQFKKRYHCSPSVYRRKKQDQAFTVHYPDVM